MIYFALFLLAIRSARPYAIKRFPYSFIFKIYTFIDKKEKWALNQAQKQLENLGKNTTSINGRI